MQADDLREMFLAMTQEVRVIIVKLADRLHNMRTLGSLKPEKRVKISRETLLVFAPLAKLLGMYSVKNELEDLAFRWSNPEAHAETARWFDELSKRQEPTVRRAAGELLALLCESDPFLKNACARVEVIPRAKELYGVYRKSQFMKKEERIDSKSTLAERLRSVREVAQLRVVLELDDADIADGGANGVSSRVCYHVLGLVHERWPPVPGRMNDYIATPKLNGYRALHTVVLPIGDFNALRDDATNSENEKKDVFPIELQIRTGEMHRMAESGIAADPEVKAAWRFARAAHGGAPDALRASPPTPPPTTRRPSPPWTVSWLGRRARGRVRRGGLGADSQRARAAGGVALEHPRVAGGVSGRAHGGGVRGHRHRRLARPPRVRVHADGGRDEPAARQHRGGLRVLHRRRSGRGAVLSERRAVRFRRALLKTPASSRFSTRRRRWTTDGRRADRRC